MRAGCVLCVLEASGRVLLENALEAVHRRCRFGDAWPQPGDPAAAWIRWVGVAPAGMECGGGAASPHCPSMDIHMLSGRTEVLVGG